MKMVQVPVLRIKQCPDTSRWYRAHVGRFVPHRAWSAADGYKSTEPGGYTNFVRTEDAEPTTALVREADLDKWPYSHMQGRQLTPVTVAKPTPCAGSCEALGICQALEDCQDKHRIEAQLAKGMVPKRWPWPAPPEGPPTRKITEGVKIHDEAAPVGQSRAHSMAETLASIAVGFVISMVILALVLPAFGHHITLAENFWIACIFTVARVLRGYGMRRLFNHLHTRGQS
jgi:hypothetical protein